MDKMKQDIDMIQDMNNLMVRYNTPMGARKFPYEKPLVCGDDVDGSKCVGTDLIRKKR